MIHTVLYVLLVSIGMYGAVYSAGYYKYWRLHSRYAARVFRDETLEDRVLQQIMGLFTWFSFGLMWLNLRYESKQERELKPVA